MNEHEVRIAFDRLVGDEPPLAARVEPVAAAGRGIRRRRRAYAAAGVAASVAVAVTGVAVATRGPSADRLLPAPVRPAAGSSAPGTKPDANLAGLTAFQRTVATAILGATPDGWTVDVAKPRWDAPNDLTTVVDDGAGATGLNVGVMVGTGWNQLLHPCHEADFAAGVSCVERALGGGAFLSVRGVMHVPTQYPGQVDKGLETVAVVLSHPDGSGINATSNNFTTAATHSGQRYTAEEKANLFTRTRPHPTFTAEQLTELVLAIEKATAG
jgi:hypothetical protein